MVAILKIYDRFSGIRMAKKYHFTINRGCGSYERTVVGRDGQVHKDETDKQGKDGHFTNEGPNRRAVEKAVSVNKRG